jgi:hypothetical protein
MRLPRELLMRLTVLLCASSLGVACGDFSGSSGGGGATSGNGVLNFSASAADITAFETTLHPVLRTNCASCHEGNGPGTPHFASQDPRAAHQALMSQGKVNLGNPGASRVVIKVSDGHECQVWTDCATGAATLLAAIEAWADQTDSGGGVSVDGALASRSMALTDGIVDTGSERYSTNLIALWEFKEGAGEVAYDTSGVGPAIDLELQDEVTWLTNWGVDVDEGMLRGSIDASRKLYQRIADPANGTQQYTIEAWVVPANIVQEGPARIVSYSQNGGARNFTLGQVMYTYNVRNRSIHGDLADEGRNGTPALQTSDQDQDAQDRLQHVVVTYDQYLGRRVYVDGVFTGDDDPVGGARLWNWDPEYRFVLANEANGGRAWAGQIRMVAIYQQALTNSQIVQNYRAGVGERLLLRFDVSEWMGPGSAIEFIVTDYDNYSYLFCQPTLITPQPNGTRISNIRIAVNGQLASSGQGFESVDAPAVSGRQELSRQCTVIPKVDGVDLDQFTLVFEHLGGYQNITVFDPVDPAPIPLDPEDRPLNGMRDFKRLNASFAEITGEDPSVAAATFAEIEQQLPSSYDLRSFVSSQQVAISKMALDYCDALVEGPDRSSFFPGFDFDEAADTAFATTAQRDLIFDPLYDRAIGDALAMQPLRGEVQGALDAMVNDLTAECATTPGLCDAARTRTIVKGSCAAVLSSAAVALH